MTFPRWKAVLNFLCWTGAFAVAYTQAPLYYSNQHQYFLHGLAQSGRGQLHDDWLANTTDPTPVFSALVAQTCRLGYEEFFYVYQVLMLGIYFQSMIAIFETISQRPVTDLSRLLFAALLFLTHAALPRMLSVRWFGFDYPVYLQSGLAAQYVLRFGLQPSVAGVFLLAAVAAFLRDRSSHAAGPSSPSPPALRGRGQGEGDSARGRTQSPLTPPSPPAKPGGEGKEKKATWGNTVWWLPPLLAFLAAAFHPTYLLGAGLLTTGFIFVLVRKGRYRDALRTGLLALLLALPVVIDSALSFRPASAETFARAEWLLVHLRIPHHTSAKLWFDKIAGLQLIWFAAALFLIRRHRIVPALLIVAGLSLALTIVQVATDSDSLALLFPWRTSAFLFPIATTIVLGRLTDFIVPRLERFPQHAAAACYWVIGILVAGGIAISFLGWGYRTNDNELPLLKWVRSNVQPGVQYLIPVNVPRLGTGKRGAFASDFSPPPRPDQRTDIAVDLQRFRLFTGVPIYVDFKSVPYKDVEVLEWKRRLDWTERAYAKGDWNAAELRQKGITHVVTTAARPIDAAGFDSVYADKFYRVYRLP